MPTNIISRRVPAMFRQIQRIHAAMTQAQPMIVNMARNIRSCQPMKAQGLPSNVIGIG
ncbi:hypothetical protein [Bradyrhizobium ottawaense]